MNPIFILPFVAILLVSCGINTPQVPPQNTPALETEYRVSPDDILSPTLADSVTKSDLSEQEKKSLLQMREEEKLAHDVYIVLYEKWGKQIFRNIAASEETHTNAVLWLLKKYSLPDSAKTEIGIFTSSKIQKLYDNLVSQGNISLLDALKVWATIEDLDIYDIDTQMKDIDNADIIAVYTQLKRGSGNHMRAFVKNITQAGWSYTPQYISQSDYTAILATEQQKWMNQQWSGKWKNK